LQLVIESDQHGSIGFVSFTEEELNTQYKAAAGCKHDYSSSNVRLTGKFSNHYEDNHGGRVQLHIDVQAPIGYH